MDGVIDYDAESEAVNDKNLWSEKDYADFVLKLEWRIKETPFINSNVPIILPDGTNKLNEKGEIIRMSVPDSDSGIYLRGMSKTQVNIWCWPAGSVQKYLYQRVVRPMTWYFLPPFKFRKIQFFSRGKISTHVRNTMSSVFLLIS